MKKICSLLFAVTVLFSATNNAVAQCPIPGTTQSQLNWDYLDYLISTGTYAASVSNARASTQYFMMGPNRVTVAAAHPNMGVLGENATHTGELANYTGQDVNYQPGVDGDSVVITFENSVSYPHFTLYDIDQNAVFTVSARSSLGVALPVTVTFQGVTILALGGIPTARVITAGGTNEANNLNTGSATISFGLLAGVDVKTIKVVITNRGSDPDFWMSDINACVTGSFPNNWRNISQPFTGMPAYILTVRNNVFYLLDPATGKAKELFTDPGHTNMNGLAYDPYNRLLYYTYSLTATPANTRSIYRYSVDNETITTLVADVNTAPLAIPTYDPGVTSGSASFYNGVYYFGVEAGRTSGGGANQTGRENTVWRIDFDGSQNPVRASQVYAARVDSAFSSAPTNRLIHDWSDIGVTNNNMLYDFDGARGDSMYYHFNLMTGVRTQFAPSGAGFIGPKQLAIDWQENVYNMGGLFNPAPGFIVPYNYNGTVNSGSNRTVFQNTAPVFPSGSWGDCSEAFRPLCDFGDAPSTYDPDPLSPAVNERDTALRIGATFDREWNKTSSAAANADGSDEDGLAYVPILSPGGGTTTYLATVSVYNNTGDTATLIAWLDYNDNGVFDAGEACQAVAPVLSSASPQTRNLYWPPFSTTLVNGDFTYLRIRIVRDSSVMTSANATGYYETGETEDYRVTVDNYPLKVNLLSFDAHLNAEGTVDLDWQTSGEENLMGYETERSADNNNWSVLSFTAATGNGLTTDNSYADKDLHPLAGKSYYRLKMLNADGKHRYSETKTITIGKGNVIVNIYPNPATDIVKINVQTGSADRAEIVIFDNLGKAVHTQSADLRSGTNTVELPVAARLHRGMYFVHVNISNKKYIEKLILK